MGFAFSIFFSNRSCWSLAKTTARQGRDCQDDLRHIGIKLKRSGESDEYYYSIEARKLFRSTSLLY